jgi:multimeric flavodoxin WrbA
MNILLISGSRNPKGQTARAAQAFLAGATDNGARTEIVFLPAMKIERCRQCDENGWGTCRTQGRCVIEDDLAGLFEKIKRADAVVFATPVYYGDLSESLRAFLDRLRRTCWHRPRKNGLEGKPAVGICVAGGGGGGSYACVVGLEKLLATCGFDILDMIPVRRQNLEMKLAVLPTVGSWVARGLGGRNS